METSVATKDLTRATGRHERRSRGSRVSVPWRPAAQAQVKTVLERGGYAKTGLEFDSKVFDYGRRLDLRLSTVEKPDSTLHYLIVVKDFLKHRVPVLLKC